MKTPTAALERQFQAEQRLASMISESSEAVGLARSLQNQLTKLASGPNSPNAKQAESLKRKVASLLEGSPEEGEKGEPALAELNEQISSLYNEVQHADAAPTASQLAAMDRLGKALPERLAEWRRLRRVDLAAFNAQLRRSSSKEVRPEWNPETQPDSENEE